MAVVITGITGFAGSFLAEHLAKNQGLEIHGFSRSKNRPSFFSSIPNTHFHEIHWENQPEFARKLKEINAKAVYHLAGYSQTWNSHKEIAATWQANLHNTLSLLEAVNASGTKPKVLIAGSGLVYGPGTSPGDKKTEESPFLPDSPYAASKAAADWLTEQMGKSLGLEIIRARPFNHIGPRQSADFAIASFSSKIARIEAGLLPPILQTGNLNSKRDLTDVRDTVHAYAELMKNGQSGEAYNIGTGSPILIKDVLQALLGLSSKKNIEVEENLSNRESQATGFVLPIIKKLRDATGWVPNIPLERALFDTLEYWRKRVREES